MTTSYCPSVNCLAVVVSTSFMRDNGASLPDITTRVVFQTWSLGMILVDANTCRLDRSEKYLGVERGCGVGTRTSGKETARGLGITTRNDCGVSEQGT